MTFFDSQATSLTKILVINRLKKKLNMQGIQWVLFNFGLSSNDDQYVNFKSKSYMSLQLSTEEYSTFNYSGVQYRTVSLITVE